MILHNRDKDRWWMTLIEVGAFIAILIAIIIRIYRELNGS